MMCNQSQARVVQCTFQLFYHDAVDLAIDQHNVMIVTIFKLEAVGFFHDSSNKLYHYVSMSIFMGG